MKNLCSLCVFLYVHFLSQALWAQPLTSRLYTTLDGLSDNTMYSVYQDRFGYMWIGTGLGLNRFDGTHFTKYGMQHGMPSLICNTMYEDRSGRFWVGTRKGIAEFRRDSFYVYETSDALQLTYVYQFYEDLQNQLIANTLQGQYLFNGIQWEPYLYNKAENREIITATVQLAEGEYFITSSELFFRNKQNTVKSIWRQPGEGLFFRGITSFDNALIVNADYLLYKVDSIKRELLFPEELKDKSAFGVMKDSRDRYWISTDEDGILILDKKAGQTTTRQIPIGNDFVARCYEDDEKQIWVSGSNGVMKLLPSTFSSMEIQEVQGDDHILNLIPFADQQLLISMNNGQLILIKYDISRAPSYEVIASYSLDGHNDFVDEYARGPRGELWLCTRMLQLYLLEDGILENKTHLVTDAGEELVLDVAYDSVSGQIIVATDSLLVVGNKYGLDTLFDSRHSFISDPRQIVITKGNQLVIRTSSGEVILCPLHDDVPNQFLKTPLLPMPGRMLKLDHNGDLWIYNGGLSLMRYSTDSALKAGVVETIDEISDNVSLLFKSFCFDQDQNIWCVGNKGIQCIYRGMDGQWVSQEHVINEISYSAYSDWFKVVEAGNKIWVNLKNQLIYFDRITPEHSEKSGDVILEEIQLHNQSTTWKNFTDSVHTYFEIPEHLRLNYHQNTLTFFYNSPTTLEAQGMMYAYRLVPADTVWSKPTGNRSISFSQLKPGSYTFQVRSRNTGMPWSDTTSFSFAIQKPFWDTTGFRILILMLVAGVVIWIFRIRLRQEKVKGEIKSQLLELEMRALRAQMNPHFIFNALNSIQSLVATNQTASANKYISKFARLLRLVLENSRRSEVTLKQELESLRLYVQLEQLRMDSEVDFTENIDELVIPELLLIPPMILQPFVENALWHGLSSKEGEKQIKLTITNENDWIWVVITDNGIGRQNAALLKSHMTQHESTAIQATEERLRDFNGAVKRDPLLIEDLFSADGTPSGTRALLHIRKKSSPGSAAQ